MFYLKLDFSQNNLLEEFRKNGFLNLTKKEKITPVYGIYDYYDRAMERLEKIAIARGYNSIEEANEKNKDFFEIQNHIDNKFISYIGGRIYLAGIIGGFGMISLFY